MAVAQDETTEESTEEETTETQMTEDDTMEETTEESMEDTSEESMEETMDESMDNTMMEDTMAEDTMMETQSPRMQMEEGVAATDVVCAEGLDLLIKTFDGSAACVMPSTAQTLIARGWGSTPA